MRRFGKLMSNYLQPPSVLTELVTDSTPSFVLSPSNQYVFLFNYPNYLTLEDVSREEIRVAGLRFNGPLRGATRTRWSSWGKICPLKEMIKGETKREIDIKVPIDSKMRMFEFSKDNKYIAFLYDGKTNTELWVADCITGEAKKVMSHLNSVLMKPFQWNENVLLISVVPEANRKEHPRPPRIPQGPVIKEHEGGKARPARTYHDLLESDHDEIIFEHYAKSQIIAYDVKTDVAKELLSEPALYSSLEVSPDSKYLLVKKVVRPYSRLLPVSRFSKEIFLICLPCELNTYCSTTSSSSLRFIPFDILQCQEDLSTSFDARLRGVRSVEFAWNEPHTLVYVMSLDEGEPEKPATVEGYRDGIFFIEADQPNITDKTTHKRLFGGPLRIEAIHWTEGKEILIEESWYKTREENFYKFNKQIGESALLYSRSSDDAYSSWGGVRYEYVSGFWRCKRRPSDGALMFIGEGANPNGSRPFLDFFNMNTLKKDRVWRSPAVPNPSVPEDLELEPNRMPVTFRGEVFQRPLDIVWANTAPLYLEEDSILLVSESPTEPPNLVIRTLSKGEEKKLTNFPHPQPSLLGVKKELIRYKREDGVDLSATLYLPPKYDGSTRLPMLCWAYPLEFKSKEHASQIKSSPYRFIHTSWSQPTIWLARGWAVLDNFSVPIVGVNNAEPNDTFTEQLVSSAEAAVNECVKRGVADPERIAVGGHSYGAYMAVHLLAHSRLFKGAIGRSGAYNRLLTPFSYQSEERTFWQAPNMYLKNSPFTHADKIEAPVLLIHGADDPNPGTHAFQSERLFAALQGLGKRARMVLLPYERHSYDALESVLHVIAEQDMFLTKYVSQDDDEKGVKRAKM